MTLPTIEELYYPYLAEHPPTHLLVAAYLGVKPTNSGGRSAMQQPLAQDFTELSTFPGMTGGDIHAGLPAPTFDFAELR